MTEVHANLAEIRIVRLVVGCCAPIPVVAALAVGGPVLAVTIASALFLAAAWATPPARAEGPIAVALVGQCALLTAAFTGHPWQIDMHMTFFAALAVIATMGSMAALVVAVGVIAAHHLVFGLLLPQFVYPSADVWANVARTALHAVIVLAEAAILGLALRARASRADIEQARQRQIEERLAASEAQRQAEQALERAAEEREAVEAARQEAERTAALIREEGRRAGEAVARIASLTEQVSAEATATQRLAEDARRDFRATGETVAKSAEAMAAIRGASDRIARIVGIIENIARRTDLLALNSAVEAARAGVAGRGFAVVAKEVQKLASQSSAASGEIRELVANSATRVAEGGAIMAQAEGAFTRIGLVMEEIDRRMQQIAAGAADQVDELEDARHAIARLERDRPERAPDPVRRRTAGRAGAALPSRGMRRAS